MSKVKTIKSHTQKKLKDKWRVGGEICNLFHKKLISIIYKLFKHINNNDQQPNSKWQKT